MSDTSNVSIELRRYTARSISLSQDGEISVDSVLAGEESKPVTVEVYVNGGPTDCRISSRRLAVVTMEDGSPKDIVLTIV